MYEYKVTEVTGDWTADTATKQLNREAADGWRLILRLNPNAVAPYFVWERVRKWPAIHHDPL